MTMTSDLRAQVLHAAAVIDPELMTGAEAAAAVEDLAMADKALGSTLMFVALRVARTNAWQGQGYQSAADWLAAKAGISVSEAHRQLGTAKKADRLPKTKEEMKKGNLSPDQADAVTDAATADPDAEDDLLDCAAHDTNKKLREEAAKRKAAATDSAERERRIRARRSLRSGTDAEGAFWARIYGPGMNAATFEAMIRPFEELMFRHHQASGVRDTYENRRYDAFFLMLAFYANLANTNSNANANTGDPTNANTDDQANTDASTGAEANTGNETANGLDRSTAEPAPASPTPSPPSRDGDRTANPDPPADHRSEPDAPIDRPPSGSPPTWSPPWDPDRTIALPDKLPGGNNTKVIVLVNHTALLRGNTEPGETCEIAGIGPVSVEAVREILRNDPFLAVVVRKGQDIVNVAHHGRGLNAHQRTAIEAAGLRCTNITCNRTLGIQIDHRVGYVVNQETKLDNQDPLCTPCHKLKTHHGHHLEAGTGPRRLLPPDHPDNPLTLDTSDPLRRTLTDDEADQIEARLRNHLAQKSLQIDQPTLC